MLASSLGFSDYLARPSRQRWGLRLDPPSFSRRLMYGSSRNIGFKVGTFCGDFYPVTRVALSLVYAITLAFFKRLVVLVAL